MVSNAERIPNRWFVFTSMSNVLFTLPANTDQIHGPEFPTRAALYMHRNQGNATPGGVGVVKDDG